MTVVSNLLSLSQVSKEACCSQTLWPLSSHRIFWLLIKATCRRSQRRSRSRRCLCLIPHLSCHSCHRVSFARRHGEPNFIVSTNCLPTAPQPPRRHRRCHGRHRRVRSCRVSCTNCSHSRIDRSRRSKFVNRAKHTYSNNRFFSSLAPWSRQHRRVRLLLRQRRQHTCHPVASGIR